MTVRVKVSHMDIDSTFNLVVTDTFAKMSETVVVIWPGGSAEFFIHAAKDLVIKQISNADNKKSGEAEASPS